MRPTILFPLFADVTTLPGVGPRNKALFERLTGGRVVDLLWHLPTGLVDRRARPKVAQVKEGEVVTLSLVVDHHQPPTRHRGPYRVIMRDDSGFLTLVFFHARADWLVRTLPEGSTRLISGRVELFQDRPQITHPDYIVKPEEEDSLPALEPLYPLTQGLGQKPVRRAVEGALSLAPDLPEWSDPDLVAREGFPSWKRALDAAHAPQSQAELEADTATRRRLAYDELLANQLALALVRHRARKSRGRSLQPSGRLKRAILDALPWQLTNDQVRVLAEIEADMADPSAMLRLVQGDVGSGKTILALLAMAGAVEAGGQAAFLAPTEILARQHFDTLKSMADKAGLRMEILTGRIKGRARADILSRLAGGEIDILVGTHALLTGDVDFADLAFVVVDEQHRFGVFQRLALAEKSKRGADVLVMTATPIPRTLTMTIYGDMDVSRIMEKPPGRKPIDTRVVSLDRLPEVIDGIVRAVGAGAQIYWVCPLVELTEKSDLAAAEDRFVQLQQLLGPKVGLVHGRMKSAEKDAVMAAFKAGDLSVLVATTVIEVGVDVPNATIMVIEHAERFGLAQLHQLRGRVGRGTGSSTCMLLRAADAGEVARSRLNIMRETEDGFLIAEEDLRLRGAGEMLGTRQSGMPEFRLADLEAHSDLMEFARDEARLVIARDPDLKGPRADALRVLLYLFERDAAVKYLKSG
ncbi:ATP-dependent DNA helicase RecG [Iodidimonas gelatinilytica]|uniref:Probable DNA 3'-5' helicase RecG n=1 Tax=Iodidimonas gelatinilytica TaxID=1236966 RepID=A0A5A7MSN8_9PROT|nr:ATP-dependent DNA helicase RecG [Iodidimonas gelatinilytica]GEQ98243.1 ATP-dependent DNA helicase RecG [Iodidimonas gelatinilytica]